MIFADLTNFKVNCSESTTTLDDDHIKKSRGPIYLWNFPSHTNSVTFENGGAPVIFLCKLKEQSDSKGPI